MLGGCSGKFNVLNMDPELLDDMWRLDLCTYVWTRCSGGKSRGCEPHSTGSSEIWTASFFHSSVVTTEGLLLTFGGVVSDTIRTNAVQCLSVIFYVVQLKGGPLEPSHLLTTIY